jgi:hypothetical protein
MSATNSRGYRNKNGANIDFNPKNAWVGQIGLGDKWLPEDQRRFAEFESHEYGIRACAALLTTYFDRHKLKTVRSIINRWAPPVENNTSAYVNAVADAMGVEPDDEINLHTYEHMRPLVEAIIRHELGGQPYAASVIDEGLRLAGIRKPVTTVAQAASTGTGRGAIEVGAVAAAAAAAAPAIQAIGSLPMWTGVAFVVGAVVLAIFVVLKRRKD